MAITRLDFGTAANNDGEVLRTAFPKLDANDADLDARVTTLEEIGPADIADHVAAADPHTQYHTDARGDARYYLKAEVDSAIAINASSIANVLSYRGYINVKDYGATGLGVSSDTTAINLAVAAATAAGKALYFPSGTYLMTGSLFLWANCVVFGDGPRNTILKMSSGIVAVVINAASVSGWTVRDLQVDGNFASTSTSGIYGASCYKYRIENVYVQKGTNGIYITGPDTGALWGMEPTFRNVIVDNCNRHGIWFVGAHDAHFENVMIIDASQETNEGYSGLYVSPSVNGRFFNVHVWHRSTVTNRMGYALNLNGGGCEFVGCHFEGAYTANVRINSTGNTMTATKCYAAWNGVNVILKQPFNRLDLQLEGPGPSRPACIGLVMGESADDNVSANMITIVAAAQEAGIIDFTYNDGANTIDIRGYNASGTNVVGSPAGTDVYRIYITGGTTTSLHNP